MSWYLEKHGQQFFLNQSDGPKGEINNMRAGTSGKLEVTLKSDEKLVLALTDFQPDGCSFSGHFKDVSSSRTAFLAQWEKLSEYHVRRQSEVEPEKMPVEKTVNGVIDTVLKDNFIGTCEVHVSNLVSPDSCRATRDVDFIHVGLLEESFKDNDFGQLVILVGMLRTDSLPNNLGIPGTEVVEVLGGNHTRLALQSLHEKGLLSSPVVKVNMYKPLPRTEALAIGFQHNVLLEEKKKPLTFVDKVKLMRECRPSEEMDASEVTSWKDMLCVIFRVESRRKLQQRMAHHLQMARLPSDLFRKVLQVNEKKQVTEKFFKSMLRINNNASYHECLDILVTKGQQAFKSKVEEYIGQGLVRSNKKSSVNEEQIHIADDDKENDVDETLDLKNMISLLQEEKKQLQRELDSFKENKRKRDSESQPDQGKWNIGDRVSAKWNDNEFYTAKIQKVETMYHVVFVDDNKKRKVSGQDLKDMSG